MKFIEDSPKTLLDISLAKVTVYLCSSFQGCSPNSKKDEFNYQWTLHSNWNSDFDRCDKCLRMIKKNVSLLDIPIDLEKRMVNLCRPVYTDINAWNIGLKQLHSKVKHSNMVDCSCLDEVNLCDSFQWTSDGSINGKKTVQKLINDKRLDINFRFLLACLYCFENDVRSLSMRMEKIPTSDLGKFTDISLPLCAYWIDWLRGGKKNVNSLIYSANYLIHNNSYFNFIVNNTTALRYFSEKNPDKRIGYLTTVAVFLEKNPELMRFCISELDEEHQEEIFRENPRWVLFSFLDRPWQRHFLEVADRVWTFLTEEDFCFIMKEILLKINAGWHDFDYTNLLDKFWGRSPHRLKEYVRNLRRDLICELIHTINI